MANNTVILAAVSLLQKNGWSIDGAKLDAMCLSYRSSDTIMGLWNEVYIALHQLENTGLYHPSGVLL